MKLSADDLEGRLRQLGRATRELPRPQLLQRAKSVAAAAATNGRYEAAAAMVRRRWLMRVVLVFIAALPIPIGFLWLDWTAMSFVLNAFLPGAVSTVIAVAYLWLKASLVGILYVLLPPVVIWFALKIHSPGRACPSALVTEG